MKTHEIKTEKGEFVVVNMEHNSWFQNTPLPEGYTTEGFIKLSEATEEGAELIVDSFELYGGVNVGYKNYTEDEPVLDTPLDSLHSLLKSKGIDINNGNWYLFMKI